MSAVVRTSALEYTGTECKLTLGCGAVGCCDVQIRRDARQRSGARRQCGVHRPCCGRGTVLHAGVVVYAAIAVHTGGRCAGAGGVPWG
eukprot:1348371-Pyramimonas_sp.AAC.1